MGKTSGSIDWGNSALKSPGAHLWFGLAGAAALVSDLASKHWAVSSLGTVEAPEPRVLIEGYFRLALVENPGAVAGLGAGKTALLLGASLAALVFVGWMFVSSEKKNHVCHLALGLILGGALGNMHDRIFNGGLVVDFLEVDLGFWPCHPWPTFNLADAWLCVGVALLLITLSRREAKSRGKEE